jgi:hypothetical protein
MEICNPEKKLASSSNIYIEELLLYFPSSWIYFKNSFSVSNKVVWKRLNLWQGLSLDS